MVDIKQEIDDIFDDIPEIDEELLPEIKNDFVEKKNQNVIKNEELQINHSLIEKIIENNTNIAEKASIRIDSYIDILNKKIYFINNELTETIPFCKDNLYLIMSQTGCGKSTVVSNIAHSLYKQEQKSLIISNEEAMEDVLMRIACLDLGLSFNMFKKGKMSNEEIDMCKKLLPNISKYIHIFGISEEGMSPTDVDDVVSVLEGSLKYDYSAILIDYFQLVRYKKSSIKNTYEILDELRIYLQKFIKKSNAPLVVMSQLYSQGKRKSSDIDARLKNNSNIMETATVCIEVIPDFAESSSIFKIHKDRFGSAGKEFKFFFKKGKYIPFSEVSIEDRLGLDNFKNVVIED